jgi:pSer/pThr/pTyr-binding forkhead associated (FHA) protein
MVLGRDDSCDISLDSRYVSRFQNLFLETPEGWMLIDLSSTNGCFVNGRRVREHRLRDGDLIAVGHHQMRFTGPSTEARPGSTAAPQRLESSETASDTTLVAARPDALERSTSH